MSVWKSDETLLSICILNFSFKNDFVWEEISNIRHSVSSPDETPRSSSKILGCASYFQLSSRCFIWWWNTASHVWYITWDMHVMFVCENGGSRSRSHRSGHFWNRNLLRDLDSCGRNKEIKCVLGSADSWLESCSGSVTDQMENSLT